MTSAFIALGSNLDDPLQQLISAVRRISARRDCRPVGWSNVYVSAPHGPVDQPDYLNAAVRLETGLEPIALLDVLQSIECVQGRKRGVRWGPRTLDLDIILFADQVIDSERLVVPHVQLANRAFVVIPLLDIEPGLVLPDGRAVVDIRDGLAGEKLEQLISSEVFSKACSRSGDSLQ